MKENVVAQKMETIQSIFQNVQETFSETETLPELLRLCESFEPEFRSIAYEAASMCLGLNDLKANDNFKSFDAFLEAQHKLHDTQIHVGLGWAFAQQQINPEPFLNHFEPMMRYRILDGYGYYEGIFRKRKSILSQQKPEFTDPVASGAYDQGLGRSFWYLNNGNIDAAKALLEKFPKERWKDMWRGLGIAIAYVGGCDEVTLHDVLGKAGEYKAQLATGAVMALVSRGKADHVTTDAEAVVDCWSNKSLAKAVVAGMKPVDNYRQWIAELEVLF